MRIANERLNITKDAYIMRGVPGSGKSTKAAELAGDKGVIHSTDTYFMVAGQYRYDPSKLQEYHSRNQAAFEQSLQDGVPVVICDNTNVRVAHMLPYITVARRYGYRVHIVELPHPDPVVAAQRNSHGATEDTIRRMLRNWEIWQE
jgi:predicted kinase